jgi:hypothetical protein
MIEPPQLFTHERLIFDIREIESLATLIMDLAIPIDRALCESFERLVELAGTRDFIVAFSKLQEHMFQIKSTQNFIVDTGSIVPRSYLMELVEWTKNNNYFSEELEISNNHFGGLIGRGDRSMHPTEEKLAEKVFLVEQLSINHASISNRQSINTITDFDTDGILYFTDSEADSNSEYSPAFQTRSQRKKQKR